MITRAGSLCGLKVRGRIEQKAGEHVLRCASGDVPLNAAAAALLSLCDGKRDSGEIIQVFTSRHHSACGDHARRFLEIAAQLGWVGAHAGRTPKAIRQNGAQR